MIGDPPVGVTARREYPLSDPVPWVGALYHVLALCFILLALVLALLALSGLMLIAANIGTAPGHRP